MGQDFKCGCRCSQGSWYLCPKHEGKIYFDNEMEELNNTKFIKKTTKDE